ncbi:MAG: hypothetical protein GQ570_07980 [Helicobacteraceae bacterium]|nr:hypothetical protein [Helicobacteraceae bacterium]
MRLLFLITIALSILNASSFKETRYISALDVEQYKSGTIQLNGELLTLTYKKPRYELLNYYNNRLTIESNNKTKELPYKEYPQLRFMSLSLRAILTDNYSSLTNLFDVEQTKNLVTLKAQSTINSLLNFITILTRENSTKVITLYMRNQDKITIETLK